MNQTVKHQKIKFSWEQLNLPKIMNNSVRNLQITR